MEATMPEQLTKHPEVTLQVLRSAGAQCGEGVAQEILTRCPAERFCKLPGGEVCVYGLPEASRMTQVSAADWAALVPRPAAQTPAPTLALGADAMLSGGIGLLIGAVIGIVGSRLRRRRNGAIDD
jgi:hypothetical protein